MKLERWNALTAAEQASFVPICPGTSKSEAESLNITLRWKSVH
jgi:hypothetical protein